MLSLNCKRLLRNTLIACALSLSLTVSQAEVDPRRYAVEVSAGAQSAPPQITLRWRAETTATSFAIQRKNPGGASWITVASLPGTADSWTDVNVANGGKYEYGITMLTSVGFKGTGYILAGINAPMTDQRGKVILVVDNTHAASLSTELARLQQDLVGDGWTVIRHDVSRTASPATVKELIRATYNSDPANVKSVFLFGHVPVPYSGNFNPDGHPDHRGAWVADTYYGEMDGTWTDSTVNNTSAEKAWNRNVPGDGKFDQSNLPSDVELQVGRVDLHNMTCFANKTWSRSELDLLRAYLDKHHHFRHGRIVAPRRGLVSDNFGEMQGEAFASTAWRNFAPFFGRENSTRAPYGTFFSTLKDNAYLWSYGTGGGYWHNCNGVGSSDDFALHEIKTVFTSFLGSYFGDWDNESNFMRAALGSGWVLATAWGGRPHWFFHHMGLGETIGYSAKISQNNSYGGLYAAQNWGTRQVHITLLGDPTLRMHPVIPPSNLSASASSGVTLDWSPSTDEQIHGYVVYRASSMNGPFTRISGSGLISTFGFTDPSGKAGEVYMVRAVKLEQSGSGTYFNPSQGIFTTAVAQRKEAKVKGRHLFYNASAWDASDAAANAADDHAVALDKTALLPGQTASFANYSSYTRGINGIMVDVLNPASPGSISVSDFSFKIGNDNSPSNWQLAPSPTSISVRPGAGVDGADRITIIWPNNAVQKQWLEVKVLATEATGLNSPDVFYFGNAVGESGNSTANAQVNLADEIGARNNPKSILNPAPITNVYDFNRDRKVNLSDEISARNHGTGFLNALRLIRPQ